MVPFTDFINDRLQFLLLQLQLQILSVCCCCWRWFSCSVSVLWLVITNALLLWLFNFYVSLIFWYVFVKCVIGYLIFFGLHSALGALHFEARRRRCTNLCV